MKELRVRLRLRFTVCFLLLVLRLGLGLYLFSYLLYLRCALYCLYNHMSMFTSNCYNGISAFLLNLLLLL